MKLAIKVPLEDEKFCLADFFTRANHIRASCKLYFSDLLRRIQRASY